MAIISALIGGVCGFLTFLTALMFFEASFLAALGLYAAVGIGVMATLVVVGLAWQAAVKLAAPRQSIMSCPVRIPAGSALSKNRG